MTDLQQLTLLAAQAGSSAIGRVLAERRTGVAFKDGRAQDPVTAADRESERAIRALVTRYRGEDAFLGEEDGLTPGRSGLRWIVDPLDGTVNFSHGLPRYAVSVAVADERAGQVVAATILQPATGAVLGLPLPSAPPRPARPDRALVAFAVPNAAGPREHAYRLLTGVAPRVQDLRNHGSTVCDLAAVATGELDAFVSFDPAPWDVAAGVALVEAAGGQTCRRRRADGVDVLATGAPAVVAALTDWLVLEGN
ncbi:inositol monophosphatase family protein [Dactylosporangium sucinum]|uniref:inositol-phosphate phosphatase n=1 Tax=Dactylosporangium sucinum TaxID=1424081 RepID=A0A917U0N2_9ACTN|nr:inositol monophosphatase family protein [Dactylosporangium sucinum]GGM47101.1 hypothetical protein GCM10007977_055940 [Dactylosporangium sucinum]